MTSLSTACPLCSNTEVSIRWVGSGDWAADAEQAFLCTTTSRARPEILRCQACRHEFSNPSSWPVDVGLEYDALEDTDYLEMTEIKRRTFSKAANLVSKYVQPPASILEVGAYAGLFLETCKARGYRVSGIEPSAWGAQLCVSKGFDVRHGTAELVLPNNDLSGFEAVVSWDVLEHVPDPGLFMSAISSAVKPGGILILSTLDRTNWFARVMGKRWPWLIPMHLHYFDQTTVVAMAENLGYSFVKTKAHVHFTSAGYALRRLLGHGDTVSNSDHVLDRVTFPVGFGDVRLYVFRKNEA
jgi:2-polyprenyl-3-methyl-5-hydroxy-6-metoxy-1,4-benzoquinol methylase